jgi:hypothetical protein
MSSRLLSKLLATLAFATSVFALPAHATLVTENINIDLHPGQSSGDLPVVPGSTLSVADSTNGNHGLLSFNSVSADGSGWITIGTQAVAYGTVIPNQSGTPLNIAATVLDISSLFTGVQNPSLGVVYLPFAFQPLPVTIPLTPDYGFLTLDISYLGFTGGYDVNIVSLTYDDAHNPVIAGVVPEPASMALVAIALLALGFAARKNKQI